MTQGCSWLDGSMSDVAATLAGRSVAARTAGALTDTPAAEAMLKRGQEVLSKTGFDVSDLGNADWWSNNWNALSPDQKMGLRGAAVGGGVGGLAGLGSSLAGDAQHPLLDTLIGAGLGAGVGGLGGYAYSALDKGKPAVQGNGYSDLTNAVKTQRGSPKTPARSIFGVQYAPEDLSNPKTWGHGIGSPIAGAVSGVGALNVAAVPFNRLARGTWTGAPRWANMAAATGGGLLGAASEVERNISPPPAPPGPPAPPLVAPDIMSKVDVLEQQLQNRQIDQPVFDAAMQRLREEWKMKKGGSVKSGNTLEELQGWFTSLPHEQQAAIIGGLAGGAGMGTLGAFSDKDHRARNGIMGMLMGAGLGAGAGYGAYMPNTSAPPTPPPTAAPAAAAVPGAAETQPAAPARDSAAFKALGVAAPVGAVTGGLMHHWLKQPLKSINPHTMTPVTNFVPKTTRRVMSGGMGLWGAAGGYGVGRDVMERR